METYSEIDTGLLQLVAFDVTLLVASHPGPLQGGLATNVAYFCISSCPLESAIENESRDNNNQDAHKTLRLHVSLLPGLQQKPQLKPCHVGG